MSSFLVRSETIASVAYAIIQCDNKYSINNERAGYNLQNATRYLFAGDRQAAIKKWEGLADAINLMNLEALGERYGYEDLLQQAECVDLEAKPEKLSPAQLLKSLHCILYQCAEGDIPQTPLYKALEDIAKNLPSRIIMCTKSYQDAAWG